MNLVSCEGDLQYKSPDPCPLFQQVGFPVIVLVSGTYQGIKTSTHAEIAGVYDCMCIIFEMYPRKNSKLELAVRNRDVHRIAHSRNKKHRTSA